MKNTRLSPVVLLALGLIVCLARISEAGPMGTAWTYQGRLIDANGELDFGDVEWFSFFWLDYCPYGWQLK
jgi:hypothetical protein